MKQAITDNIMRTNKTNQICPVCGEYASKNGFNKAGEQKYVCRRHRPSWSYNGSGIFGSEPLGDRAMTAYERIKKYRAKKALEDHPKKEVV